MLNGRAIVYIGEGGNCSAVVLPPNSNRSGFVGRSGAVAYITGESEFLFIYKRSSAWVDGELRLGGVNSEHRRTSSELSTVLNCFVIS